MKLSQKLYVVLIASGIVSCGGQGASPENEYQLIASEFNMDLNSLFFCTTTISADANETLYNGLLYGDGDLNVEVEVVYTVFFGTNPPSTERIVRAEVSFSETDTLNFKQSSSIYLKDSNMTSKIAILADVSNGGDNLDGIWEFSMSSNVASFVYSDSDLPESLTYSFINAEDDSNECIGDVKNNPVEG